MRGALGATGGNTPFSFKPSSNMKSAPRFVLHCTMPLALALSFSSQAATSTFAYSSDYQYPGIWDAQTNTVNPFSETLRGMTAELKFNDSSPCTGGLCDYSGPAVGVSLYGHGNNDYRLNLEADLSYTVQISGGSEEVPLIISGRYLVNDPKNPVIYYNSDLGETSLGVTAAWAGMTVMVPAPYDEETGLAIRLLTRVASTCINGDGWAGGWAGPTVENCQSGKAESFSQKISAPAGSTLTISLSAGVQRDYFEIDYGNQVSAYIDPYIQIDPAWASSHPGYSLALDAGVGNVSSVPESGTWVMMLGGLASLWYRHRRPASKATSTN